jgi:hypothetical protein
MTTIKHEVAAKFPQQENVVIVVWFLRFICPAILQPHVYGVTEGIYFLSSFLTFAFLCFRSLSFSLSLSLSLFFSLFQ